MSSAFYSFISSITNSITSRYDIKQQISSSGLWKIYQGERKTTGKKVALFIFEKKSLDASFKRDRGSSRQDSEYVYELLKKEAGNLAKLRHPSILEVVEPVSESRSSIVFVTEPLMGSLTHLVKSSEHYSSESQEPSLDLDELEIQKGLLQIGKGLQFFNDAKVVHHNLTTDAVFVNAKGDWKIGGLGFSVFLNNADTTNDMRFDNNNSDYLPEACQVNMDYAAPEFLIENNVCQANDMFSLGCLAYAVHNKGVSFLKTFNSLHAYEKQIKSMNASTFSNIPEHLKQVIRALLVRHPSQRMTPSEFQNSKYFDNLLVSTMKFLESFPEKTREEKAQFMKGLSRVLGQFPERVLRRKILPSLLEELKDAQLLPYTVPNIFIITQQLSQQEFCDLVLPALKPIFNVRDPPQNMIVLLEKLDVLQKKTPREIFRDEVMPLVYAALDAPTAVVQEKALRIIPSLAESLDYTAVKSSLFPRVQTVFVQTTILSVKVSTLICFHAMIKVLDKFTVQEKLVPLLKNIKTKEPAVMLATLAVYDEVGKVADKEIIATEILPQLWRMSFGPLLNLEQFQKFMRTIHDLTKRVEEAHTRHLKEVKSLEEQTRNVSAGSSPQPATTLVTPSGNDVSFESLVGGGGSSSAINSNSINHVENDMFGSMLSPTTTNATTNKTTTTSSGASTWSKPSTTTTSSNILNSSWSSSSPQYQHQSLASSNWNSQPPIKPISSPKTLQNNSLNSGMNNLSMNNNNNYSQQQNAWSPSLQAIKPTIQGQQFPSSSSTNTIGSAAFTMNNNSAQAPNYSALQGLSSGNTSNYNSQPTMRPLSSTMGLLQPTTTNTSNTNNLSQKPSKPVNLHAFDPLG